MVDTKSPEQAKKNWEDAIGRAATAYATGVRASTGWQAAAIAGEELYAQKVQEAIASKRRAAKLAEVSDEQWKKAALDKGANRIASGMTASKEKFGAGIARVIDAIRGVQLPPRVADPIANVDNRVKPIVLALAKLKQ